MSLGQQLDKVHEAVYEATKPPMPTESYSCEGYAVAVFDTYVIIRVDDKFWKADYTLTDGEVTLADRAAWVEVESQWVAVKTGFKTKGDEMLVSFGDNTVKTWIKNGMGYVEALGILYGNSSMKDLTDEYFAPDTDYGPNRGNGMAATLNHRVPMIKQSTNQREAEILRKYAKQSFSNPVSTRNSELGIVASHILDLSDEYEKMVFDMTARGKLRWSSGSAPHMVDLDDDGKIKMWHIIEWAYTPMAAEPRLPTITTLKSWIESQVGQQALAQTAGDAVTQSATDEKDSTVDTGKAKRLSLELDLLSLGD